MLSRANKLNLCGYQVGTLSKGVILSLQIIGEKKPAI